MKPPQPASIVFPTSQHVVSVKIMQGFESFICPSALTLTPAPGSTSDESKPWVGPCKSFLIEHPSGKKVLFDLGMVRDYTSLNPDWQGIMERGEMVLERGLEVPTILGGGGYDLADISAIIWSHTHLDHVGDVHAFPHSTEVVVGPGTMAALEVGIPGPHVTKKELNGRKVDEIQFDDKSPVIGGFPAYDYFNDGSFYLLSAPGHCVGHLMGLARTTADPASFIFMAGDAYHHPAQLRPSEHKSLPQDITVPAALAKCARNAPFLSPPQGSMSVHADCPGAVRVQTLIRAFDARDDVLVIIAHDGSGDVEGLVKFFPRTSNAWMKEGLKDRLFWAFLEQDNPANRWE